MTVPVTAYSVRFSDSVRNVMNGRRGSISDSRFLIDNYGAGCYEVLIAGLEHPEPKIRAETVMLFSRLGITKPRERIEDMSVRDKDVVVGACIAYLKTMDTNDGRMPDLLYTVNHRDGTEFRAAMRTIGAIATEKDIPEIRKVYGQVQGEMREQTAAALSRIVDRDPDLERKRDFILSLPRYPDEGAYLAFLRKSIKYLDVRYRKNVEPRSEVSVKLHNDVAHAIITMQIRMYNEAQNMPIYSAEVRGSAEELSDLISWAADDLNSKRVVRPEDHISRTSRISDYQ